MGFLKGVLGAVKDENEVTTYDNYITPDNKKLKSVLDTLTSSIGTGRAGLAVSVAAVKEWLEGYEGKHTWMTYNVTNELGRLVTNLNTATGKYYHDVASKHNSPLADQLRSWTQTIAQIEADISSVENNNVNVLDSAINEKLMHELNVVKSAVGMLKDSAGNGELVSQVKKVDEELEMQLWKVLEGIGKLEKTKNDQLEYIRGATKFAEKCIISQLGKSGGSFRNTMLTHFSDIKYQLSDIDPKDKSEFPTGKSELRKVAENIATQLIAVGEKLQHNVNALEKWKTKTKNFIDGAKQKFVAKLTDKGEGFQNTGLIKNKAAELKEWKEKLESYINDDIRPALRRLTTEATKQIEELERVYKEKLAEIRDDVLAKVGDENRGALQKLNDLDEEVKKDLRKLRGRIKTEVIEKYFKNDLPGAVKKVVEELVKPIHEDSSDPASLGRIVKQIGAYVGEFENKFKEGIGKWLDELLKEGVAEGKIRGYVLKGGVGGRVEKHKAVRKAIVNQVLKLSDDSIHKATFEPDDVQKTLNSIQKYLEGYADQVGLKIDSIGGFIMAVEKDGEFKQAATFSLGDTGLQTAFQNVLSTVKKVIESAKEECSRFITTSKMSNLMQAINKVKGLGNLLETKLGDGGDTVTALGKKFIVKVCEDIDVELGGMISDGSIHFREEADADAGLMSYYMKQTKTGALPGTLRHTIEKIKNKVETEIHGTLGANSRSITIRGVEPTSRTNLDETISRIGTISTDLTVKLTTDALESLSTQIRNNLNKLLSSFAITGRHINAYFNTLQTEYIDVELDNIQKGLDSLHTDEFSTTPGTVQQAVDNVTNIIQHLEMVHDQLDKKKEDVIKHMDDLENDLSYRIENIEANVREANTALGNLIKCLTDIVKSAFYKLTSEVRSLFAEQKKADLMALKTLVNKQLEEVKTIVETDKITGLKGFLSKMKDYFVKRINDHMSPQQPPPPAQQPPDDQSPEKTLADMAESLNDAFKAFLMQLQKQSDFTSDFEKIRPSTTALHTLLETLVGSKHFDYKFRDNLEKLDDLLRCLMPHTFGEGQAPSILEALRKGLPEMLKELDKAYVSRYSGHKVQWTEGDDGKETLTRNAMKCGKVLLSVIPMFGELMRINQECMSKEWYKKIIFRRNENNPVAKFLEESGYSIPSSDTKQEGDLRCGLTTLGIADRLSKESKLCTYMGRDDGTLKILYDSLKRYNEVCHLTLHSKPRHPCSVFDMLVWLTSLSYNSVYLDLTSAGFSDLFDKPEKKDADDKKKESGEDEPMVTDLNTQTLAAYPRNVTYGGIQDAITHITHKAHELLVTIVGTGDASTIYSCDLSNNSLGFKYPTTATDCLQMLIDVLCALLPSLRYLERQCSLANQHSGWAKCFYGKGVKSFKWPCNDHSSDKATCQPNAKPNCQPNGQPNCQPNGQPNCQPNCQPSSPLMSYLNDCLPGHMPHRLQSVGCKAECKTCPTGQPGMPCITPLGFKAFSGSIKTGKELCNIIREFLGHEYISGLLSLMPKPPSTLPQHFGFMLSIVRGWVDSAKLRNQRYTKNSFQSCFETSIASQSIRLYSDPSELTKAFTNAYGSQSVMHETCNYPHLVNLTSADICSNPSDKVDCAPYLMSLCDDSYYYVGYKHAGAYLSWAVYLPWTFWRYLNSLYNEFCNISCNDWGCSKCMHGDMCKPGKHGHVDEKSGISHCQCPSIVGCRGVSSTLYKFGFTFDDAKFLNRLTSAKTCTNFCTLLKSILHSQYFTDLFTECDNFIWTIREPFTYLVLALWSLSLFYLICVMVGRLDVLHIRSHLRIPSSHRITAQSLLAAAQVGRLAKISYLQP